VSAESKKGRLLLIPTPLGNNASDVVPSSVIEAISPLSQFVVENLRSARRALRAMGFKKSFDDVAMEELPRDNDAVDWRPLLKPLLDGHDMGLLSEAGYPGVADPGTEVIRAAHALGVQVVPLPGVSSITLALMASGLNGQSFIFHGYLPINDKERRQAIRELERKAASGQTQIFIEAPYRNNQLMRSLLSNCQHDTMLCVATELTLPSQVVSTKRIADWKQQLPELNKRPSVFLLGR
jgi:16S rRNA (cytidine1402-2'-O)-methyltransferase